jgi:hypothetical protein
MADEQRSTNGESASTADLPRQQTSDQAEKKLIEPERQFTASIFPGEDKTIPTELALKVQAVEKAFAMPTWVIVQQESGETEPYADLGEEVWQGFFAARAELAECQRIALVLDSPGGFARETYQIATLFQRHCGGFVAVVPRMAKSAATLLVLGSDQRCMGADAELGPLDVQLLDYEEEEWTSPLDEVQALDRLRGVALEQFDETLYALKVRTRKKMSTLMPLALEFTSQMMRPLVEKVDTVHYAKQSRILKVAEEYAIRLLKPNVGEKGARAIASRFVNEYPEHGFIINREEANEFFPISDGNEEQATAIAALEDYFTSSELTVIGRVKEREVEVARDASVQ